MCFEEAEISSLTSFHIFLSCCNMSSLVDSLNSFLVFGLAFKFLSGFIGSVFVFQVSDEFVLIIGGVFTSGVTI